ncbi:MAG: DUF3883 domain-containing protein [Candidatus Acidiferrales bacterium]
MAEGDTGSRGWFLITRVHLSTARLREIVSYLYDVGAEGGRELHETDYRALAAAAGIEGDDPGITLRRHYLLALERPLNLLQRVDERHWSEVRLTGPGVDLATNPNSSAVLESILSRIVFCREPWYTRTRVREYEDFQVHPYPTALRVMSDCGGWLDRDEYDLFLSRVRRAREMRWAVEGILEFRVLSLEERARILNEVRRRIAGAKAYQNWRDMALHTFSLFNLGASAVRVDQRLMLTARLVEGLPAARRGRAAREPARRREVILRIPEPDAGEGLESPPTASAVNPGTEGELLIGKLLEAGGWRVVFYNNRRGFGFDLWASRGHAAIVIEVKSSFEELGGITLTRLEYEAARAHGRNYILATVENLRVEAPVIRFIQDPARVLDIQERNTREYAISRGAWIASAQPFDARNEI